VAALMPERLLIARSTVPIETLQILARSFTVTVDDCLKMMKQLLHLRITNYTMTYIFNFTIIHEACQ